MAIEGFDFILYIWPCDKNLVQVVQTSLNNILLIFVQIAIYGQFDKKI